MRQSSLQLSRSQLEGIVGKDDPDALRKLEKLFANVDETGGRALRGSIDGLICREGAAPASDVTIGVGVARDSSNTVTFELEAELTKRITLPWAFGNNAGGLRAGLSLAPSTWYYLHLIQRASDGVIDAIFDTSETAPVLPAGWLAFRCIRAFWINAAGEIEPTDQDGDVVTFRSIITNYTSAAFVDTLRNAYTVSAPPNMNVLALITVYNSAAAGNYFAWFANANRPDVAADSSTCTHWVYVSTGTLALLLSIKTNASSQIFGRSISVNLLRMIKSYGWIDRRGKNAA